MSLSPERVRGSNRFDAAIPSSIVAFVVSLGATVALPWTSRGAGIAYFGLLGFVLLLGALVVSSLLVWFWRVMPRKELEMSLKPRANQIVLAAPVLLLAWWGLGLGSLQILGSHGEAPLGGGLLLALLAVSIAGFSSWLVTGPASRLPALAISAGRAALIAALILGCGVALSVAVGSTSGSGGALALFGVFKRPELDLSGIAQLTIAALGSAALAARLRRRSPRVVTVIALICGLSLAAALVVASRLNFKEAVAVQRQGGLASAALQTAQRLFDGDRDGFASAFGGGDCNDQSSQIHPAAIENYDNAVDENCDGIVKKPISQVEGVPESPQKQITKSKQLPSGLNVLLLTVDTMRAELGYSGLAGTRPNISPHLDALAAKSAIFERAYSLASYTSKSLGPMLVGRYPSEVPRSFEHFDRFPADAVFVQERIAQAGLQTLSIQGYWYFYFKGYGFERGWETLEHSSAPRHIAIEGDKTSNGAKVADDAIMYLKQLADRPKQFFMWTHWVDPHAEYVQHEAHNYGSSERERYDGEISFVDAQIGRILAALEETALDKTTAIIVSSDHGEAFGEHGLIRHGFEVWEELVHVPLLVYIPGLTPRRIAAPRSLIDVAPTIMETLALRAPEQGTFSGKSLVPDILADEHSSPESRPVLVDMPAGPHNKERRAFYFGDLKLIVSAGQVLGLFDLKKDPMEKTDLSEDAELLATIRIKFDEFVAKLKVVPATK